MRGEERGWKVTRRIQTSTFTFVKSAWNTREDARLCFKQWSLAKRFLVPCFIARKIFPVIVRILWIFELWIEPLSRVVLDSRNGGSLFFFSSFFFFFSFFYSKFVKIAVTSFVFKMPEKVKIPICAFYHMFVNICIYIYMYVKSLYYVFTSVSSTTIRVWDVVLYFYRLNHDIVFNISKMLGYVRNTNRYLKKINTKISSGNRVYKNCSKEELQ